jgi:hypothetical protein
MLRPFGSSLDESWQIILNLDNQEEDPGLTYQLVMAQVQQPVVHGVIFPQRAIRHSATFRRLNWS